MASVVSSTPPARRRLIRNVRRNTHTMFGILKKLFPDRRADWRHSVSDPVIGELVLSSDGDWWEGSLTVDGTSVQFQLGGDREPSLALISHAHDIIREFAVFSRTVSEFLDSEAAAQAASADEIRQLALESVCLFWPDRPNDGMLYFNGADEYRVWRCDYINRKPQGLGFDD